MVVAQDSPNVHLELVSEPESVAVVRAMLTGVADLLGFDHELLDDLSTAVSEACNNVVLHAYGAGTGPLVVHLEVRDDDVEVTVRDHGTGIQRAAVSEERLGVGLSLIGALAHSAEFLSAPDGGTEVRLAFRGRIARLSQLERPVETRSGSVERSWREDDGPVPVEGDVVATVSPVALLPGVLGRVARVLAAKARFSLERFSDVYLVIDGLVAHTQREANARKISVGLDAAARRLQLRIGPLRAGAEAELHRGATPELSLVDELAAEPTDHSEVLMVVLRDRHSGPPGSHSQGRLASR